VDTLKKQEGEMPMKDIYRNWGVSDATIYNYKANYGSTEASDVNRVKNLQPEKAQLKSIYA
jgi:putative transposase